MEFDEFGFPKREEFRERRGALAPKVTAGRMVALFFVVAIAVGVALLVKFGPDLSKMFANGVFGDPRDRFLAERRKLDAAMQAGKLDQAAQSCERLLRMQPNSEPLYNALAELYFRAGDAKAAIKACDRWGKAFPDSLAPYHQRALIYNQSKDHAKAIEECSRALVKDPDDATALNNRAYFRALGRVDVAEAMQDITVALEKKPDNYIFLDTRGYLHYLQGNFAAARADYDRILEDDDFVATSREEVGEIFFHRGLLRKALGDEAGKKRDYQEAVKHGFKIENEPEPMQRPTGVRKA